MRILDGFGLRTEAILLRKSPPPVVSQLMRAMRLNKAADPVEEKIRQTLGCYSFPDIHWRKVRTNNPLERLMKEIPKTDQGRRGLSRWSILSLTSGGQVATRRRHTVAQAKAHAYGSAARDETSTQWSRRRMIESANDSGHYLDRPHYSSVYDHAH